MAFLVIGEVGEDEIGLEYDVCVRWDEVGVDFVAELEGKSKEWRCRCRHCCCVGSRIVVIGWDGIWREVS